MRQVDLSSQLPIEMPSMGQTWAMSLCTLAGFTGTARPRSVRTSCFGLSYDIGPARVLRVPITEVEGIDHPSGSRAFFGGGIGPEVDAPGRFVVPVADAHAYAIGANRQDRVVQIFRPHVSVTQLYLQLRHR